MLLDYKDIIIKHYALGMSGREIAEELSVSKSGVNKFLAAFKECKTLSYPLPEGITNYGIAAAVYGQKAATVGRDLSYEMPDYEAVAKDMSSRKNMTLVVLWNRYAKKCRDCGLKFYSYRQFCENYAKWCEENKETLHFNAVIGQKMEVDFAGKTFQMVDHLTGEVLEIVVFVAVLPYSQYIYAEGMVSTKEPQWIAVNNNALTYFGGVPALVVCDNCKQAVIANRDWIAPELNKDYAEWAEYNHTVILPAKVKKPKYKSSVENAVGIMEKGFFHDMEEMDYFSLEQFNRDLWKHLDKLNSAPFTKKPHSRRYYWDEERRELMPLPPVPYEYMERRTAKVSSDYHVRFDNAYYSVDRAYLHKEVLIRASATMVKIFSKEGALICEWPRATAKSQWSTDPNHLPANYREISEWNGTYFTRKAMTIGPNTGKVIKRILASRKLEVQTYRMCQGVLSFTRKYSKQALEETCRQALELGKVNYTFIKNTIPVVAEDLGVSGYNTSINEERKHSSLFNAISSTSADRLVEKLPTLLGLEIGHLISVGKILTPIFVFDSYQESQPYSESEEWLYQLIKGARRGVYIVTSREPIHWTESSGHLIVHNLECYPEDDARKLLEETIINRPDLVDQIIESTQCVPIYIDLALNVFESERTIVGEVLVEKALFSDRHKLVHHFISHMKPSWQSVLLDLATIRIFNYGTFEHLVKCNMLDCTPYELSTIIKSNLFSYISESKNSNLYKLHDVFCKDAMSGRPVSECYSIYRCYLDYLCYRRDILVQDNNGTSLAALFQNAVYLAIELEERLLLEETVLSIDQSVVEQILDIFFTLVSNKVRFVPVSFENVKTETMRKVCQFVYIKTYEKLNTRHPDR